MYDSTRSNRPGRKAILDVIQGETTHVYALVTRDGAIKIGVTTQLSQRYKSIKFGGTDRYLGFKPGEYVDEQAIHDSIPDDLRIAGHREYYYPLYEWMLPPLNEMRSAMGIRLLDRRDLPRTGHWARRLPVAQRDVTWPWPAPWPAKING